ncbi:MAG: ATP-binding protein, partial [Methanogenium sp.]|nr:ATP-binding protein [Methanogenium sp.]
MEVSFIREDLRGGETLTCEFKSDLYGKLELSEIVETVVGMANTQGGVLYIGVEDDGAVTGVQHLKNYVGNTSLLMADIQKKTMPPVFTTTSVHDCSGCSVLAVDINQGIDICSTTQGKVLKRIISTDGKPATVPMYPYEQQSRRTDLGLLDYSAQKVEGTSFSDLNPLEFERLRQTIKRRNGDPSLLELSDEEFCKALNLVETVGTE